MDSLAEWSTHHFTLGNELSSVKLRNDALQNFVSNGRKNPFVIVQAEILVNFGEVFSVRSGENSKCDRDHLHVLGTSCRRDVLIAIYQPEKRGWRQETHPGLDSAVIEDSALEPRNQEMGPFAGRLSSVSIEVWWAWILKRTWLFTPEKRSNITALNPPGTSYRLALTAARPIAAGTGARWGTRRMETYSYSPMKRLADWANADIVKKLFEEQKGREQATMMQRNGAKQMTTRSGGTATPSEAIAPALPLGAGTRNKFNCINMPFDIQSNIASPFFSPSMRAEWLPNCIALFFRQLASTRPSFLTSRRSNVLSPNPTASRGSSL